MSNFIYDRRAVEGMGFTSNSIRYVGYNRSERLLGVQFKSGDNIFSYENVDESTYNVFIEAESLNAFWRTHISGKYNRGDTFTDWAWVDGLSTASEIRNLVNIDKFNGKYGITWTLGDGSETFEYLTEAVNDVEAVAVFNTEANRLFGDASSITIKVVSVTRYFE